VGGATRAVQQLAHSLDRRGHEVAVATAWQDGPPAFEREGDIDVHRLRDLTSRVPGLSADPYRHTPPPYPDPEATVRFRRLLRRFRPDVVHSYGWISYSLAAALGRRGTPLVLSLRDYGNFCPKRTLVRHGEICSGPAPSKCMECAGSFYGQPKGTVATAGVLHGRSLLRRRVHARHSVSSYVDDLAREHLFPNGMPVRILPDYRDPFDASSVDRALLDRLPSEPYLMFVGALREVKGLGPLLAAYERLEQRPPLVLVGARAPDTPERFPEGVVVLDPMPNQTVLAAWDGALFGLAPSTLAEPLGNVVHEAMSRGKPVIGTRPGGHRDMIEDGVTGLLVDAGDTTALGEAMRRLLADEDLRARMGEAARERAARFVEEAVVPELESLYAEAIAAARQAP
jgi:glycosyltransferase involved in cell wall biosynthesis